MEIHIRDENCPICKGVFSESQIETFLFKSLELVVHLCEHTKKTFTVARKVVSEHYGDVVSVKELFIDRDIQRNLEVAVFAGRTPYVWDFVREQAEIAKEYCDLSVG